MKKVLFAFASAVLALTSCSNESEIQSLPNAGEEAMATIRVGMAPKTRATIDNDGAAAHVNRCILEVRTGGEKKVYRHVEVSVDPATLTATFQLPLVISQTYDFLFWADNANFDSSIGKFSDKYYDTQDLTKVKILDETTGNLDAKDAFFAAGLNVEFTGTVLTPMEYTLTRPFAQVNIVTTDLLEINAANDPDLAADELWPATISVNYTTKFPTQFDVSTGVASEPKVISRKAEAVYGCAEAKAYNTLNMDYIFVGADNNPEEKTLFGITKAEITSKNGEVITILVDKADIPLKRNYRTNIIGSFLTDPQDFKVTVNPIWYEPDYNPLPSPAADPQGCSLSERDDDGNMVATYEEGSSVVVVPEGVTKFIPNPANPTSAGGVYNMNIESLTMPSTIEFWGYGYTSFCKNITTVTWTCNPEHDFTIDMNQALYGTGENCDVVTLNITGLPKSFKLVKRIGNKYVEQTTDTPGLNFGDGSGRTLIINLPAGWIDASYPYKFIAGGDHHCEVYENDVLVSKSTYSSTPVTVFE